MAGNLVDAIGICQLQDIKDAKNYEAMLNGWEKQRFCKIPKLLRTVFQSQVFQSQVFQPQVFQPQITALPIGTS